MDSGQTRDLKWASTTLCVFIAGSYLSPTLSFSKLTISFIGIVALFYFLLHRHAFYSLVLREKMLVLFLLMTVLSCAWGDSDSFAHAFKSSLVTLLFVFYISHFREGLHRNLNVILMTMVLSAGILATVLLYAHFSTHGFNLTEKMQVTYGPIVQTIRTASVFTIALLVMIWNVFTKKGCERWACALLFFPVLLVMLLLQSRGAVLALGVGASVLYVVHNARSARVVRHSMIGMTLLVMLVLLGALFSLKYNPRGISDTLRVAIWWQSIQDVYPEKVLWGIGLREKEYINLPEDAKFSHSHNMFVSIFRFTGAIGLASFCAYLIAVFRRSIGYRDILPEGALFWAWAATALCVYFFVGKYPVYIAPDIFLLLWLPLALMNSRDVENQTSE